MVIVLIIIAVIFLTIIFKISALAESIGSFVRSGIIILGIVMAVVYILGSEIGLIKDKDQKNGEFYDEETVSYEWDTDTDNMLEGLNEDTKTDGLYEDIAGDEIYDSSVPVDNELQDDADEWYILADSSERLLNDWELEELDSEMLRLARNEIYARHGRRFKDQGLQEYFDSMPWYEGTVEPEDFDDGVLNKYEKANLNKIAEHE